MDVQMYASPWCPDCRAAKRFLDSHGIQYTEINVDRDAAASFQPYIPGRGLLVDELHERLGIPRA